MKTQQSKILPYLIVLAAVLLSGSAAYYSVTGIGKLFAGASTVMVLMATLEATKLILASFVYRFWKTLSTILKTYYVIALLILMLITSAGIYGYLASAYSKTSAVLQTNEMQMDALNQQKELYTLRLKSIQTEKESVMKDIPNLVQALSNNYIEYKDKNGNIMRSTSGATRKVIEDQLKSSRDRIDDLTKKEGPLNDSIFNIDSKILSIKNDQATNGDIGPLMYIAKLANTTTDHVANWFIIALMFVFDPLAISLIIGANMIFAMSETEKVKVESEPKEIELEAKPVEPEPEKPKQVEPEKPKQVEPEKPKQVEPEKPKDEGKQFHWKHRR